MNDMILYSKNLYLRKMIKSDVDYHLKLYSDPDVIGFLNPPKPDREFYLKNIKRQNNYYDTINKLIL